MNTSKLRYQLLAVSRLRDDASEIFTYRITDGLGEAIVKTYTMLHNQIVADVKDDYIEGLRIPATKDMSDRQMIALVKLLSGQLKAYLESKLDGV